MSLITVTAQYNCHTWPVEISKSLCDSGNEPSVRAQICAAAPASVGLPADSELSGRTSTGAAWKRSNIKALTLQKYFQLVAAGQPVAASRQMMKRLLPASGVLTRPASLPEVSDHESAVLYISCEPFDNSIRGMKGIRDASKRKIIAFFQLAEASHPLGRKYIAYLDLGSGMSVEAMERWASTGTLPEIISLLGEQSCFADADLSKFGYGSKYASFNLGNEVNCVSRPRDADAPVALQTMQDIYELRLNKAVSDAADAQNGEAFSHPFVARHPHTDKGWRQDWEKHSDGLMDLFNLVDDEPHFTLLVISDLNPWAVRQLTEHPFPVLCRSLRGMYPYYTSRGGAGQEPRFNFMPTQGFEDGPVSIEVRGAGFKPSADEEPTQNTQCHKLESPPYRCWPQDPEDESTREFEAGIDALARHTLHSSFPDGVDGIPEVQGSKFVFGAIIPGASNKANQEDVFVVFYCHYMPIRNGRATKRDLRLKEGVPWFMYWKGRGAPMADITAVPPFMKRPSSRDPSQDAFWQHAQNQVVGQIFFPSTANVDTYKLKFNQAIDEQIKNANEFFRLDETVMWQNGERLTASEVRLGMKGVTPTRLTQITERYRSWVKKCINSFDEQWQPGQFVSQPTDDVRAFERLTRVGPEHISYQVGSHVLIERTGKSLSLYRDSHGKLEQRNTMLGAVLRFTMPRDGSLMDAKVQVTREPEEVFGRQVFEFGIHKLRMADKKQYAEKLSNARDAVPARFTLTSAAGGQNDAPSVRPRPMNSKALVSIPAKSPLKQTVVRLHNNHSKGNKQPGREVTHWTQAGPGNQHDSTVPIVVEEVIKDDAGKVLLQQKADLGDVGDGTKAFIFKETGNRALPKPGDYIVQYSATMLNRGGQQYHRTITSAEFKYRAASGPADVCDLSGWPDKIQLGTIPTDMQLCLRDGSGNYTRAAITSVKLSSDHLDVTCEDGQWGHTAEGHDALQLAAVVLKPRDTFQPLGADKAVKCDVKLHVVLDRGHELTADYKLDVFTGKPSKLEATFTQPCFSETTEEPETGVENHAEAPGITFKLLDADVLEAVAQATASRVVVKLHPAIPNASVNGGEATFNSTTHRATLGKLCINLPPMSQARTVTLQASVPGSAPAVEPVTFKAHVVPSTAPCSVQLFTDAACTEAMPTAGSPSNTMHIFKQPAGEKVEPFFLRLQTEAQTPKLLPAGCTIKLGNKAAGHSVLDSGMIVEVVPPADLRAPASIEETKDVALLILKDGIELCKGLTVQLTSIAGPAEQWAFVQQRTPVSAGQRIQLKNGEDISRLLPAAYLRDRRDNRHDALPDGFDLDVVPQLQVSPAEMPESNQRAPVFSRGGQTLLNTISGIWSFNASTRLLSISEVAIVGAPGPVSLTLSGGTSPAGVPLQAATLHAHLALGKVSTDKLGVDHWPTGPVSLCYQVQSLLVTLQDAGGNTVPLPSVSLFVIIDPLPGSTATLTAYECGSQQLAVTKAGTQLKVAPFLITSQTAGAQYMRLRVCKNKQHPSDVAAQDLPPLHMNPSSLVVSSIEVDATTTITAGDMMPSLTLRLHMEDGSVPEVTGYYNNLAVTCTSAAGQAVPMHCRPDGTKVICEPVQAQSCETATTYKVSITYQPPASTDGVAVVKGASITVRSGAAHAPSLPEHAITVRLCFNVGSPAQRTITPSAPLTLCDRFGNPATLGAEEPAAVSFRLSATSNHASPDAQCPQLAASSTQGISMQSTTSTVALSPVLVAPDTSASSGCYQLSIRVHGVPEPLVVPFTFTDASGWSQEMQAAQLGRDDAQRRVNELTAALAVSRGRTQNLEAAAESALARAQRQLNIAVGINNWQQVRDGCQLELQQLPDGRPARLTHCLVTREQRAQLDTVPEVIGFAHELLYVAGDDEARLLSWFSQGCMWDLFVTDAKCKPQILRLWSVWGLMGQRLTIRPLPFITATAAWLPHSGLGIELPGNPTLFSSLVHCCHVGGMPLSEQQQHQIISTFCRGALLMDTEAAAGQYRRHVTQHRSCASIVCRDTGSVIAADGGFAIGHGATAPSSISQLRTCLGAPRKESTEAFRRCSAALASLQSMPWLLHQISVAQAEETNLQDRLETCNAELTAAERSLAAATEQMRQLRPVQPGGATAVGRSINASSNASRGVKRGAADQHSNNMASPHQQRQRPRRGAASYSKALFQEGS